MDSNKLPIHATLSAAWDYTKGFKKRYWTGLVLFILFSLAILSLLGLINYFSLSDNAQFTEAMNWGRGDFNSAPDSIFAAALGLLVYFAGRLLQFYVIYGMEYLTLRRQANLPLRSMQVFKVFQGSHFWRLLLNLIIKAILIFAAFFLPTILLNTPANLLANEKPTLAYILEILYGISVIAMLAIMIYFGIRLALSSQFILDEKIPAIVAIRNSYRVTQRNFWRMIAIYGSLLILYLIALSPIALTAILSYLGHNALGIWGWLIAIAISIGICIWFFPFASNANIKIYATLAGGIKMRE